MGVVSTLQEWDMNRQIFWHKMNPLRTAAKWLYRGTIFGPTVHFGAKMTIKGLRAAVDGARYLGYAGLEAGTGLTQMTVGPAAMIAKSRLVAMKRMAWDFPWAVFGAAIRTPIALGKSPVEMVLGVRDAVKNIPENLKSILDGNVITGIRGALSDLLLPITRPLKSITAPSVHAADVGVGAQLQTVATVGEIAANRIPTAWERIGNSFGVARAKMMAFWEDKARLEAAKEALAKAEREQLEKAIYSKLGEEPPKTLADMGYTPATA